MYPQRDLIRLAAHKAALRKKISRHRAHCVEATHRLARPVAWADRAVTFVRGLSPLTRLAALPLIFILPRVVSPRLKLLRSALRWSPLALAAARAALRASAKPN